MVWDEGLGRRWDFLFRDWVRKGQLQMRLLGPGLGGSCTPPHKWLKHVVNDSLSTRFDDSFGWASVSGIWGGGGAAKGLGAKRVGQHHAAPRATGVKLGLKID